MTETARADLGADEQHELLEIYLADHLAGATAGAQRARRLAEAAASAPDDGTLSSSATDVEADRDALSALMEVVNVSPSQIETALASVAERLGALKTFSAAAR